MAIAYSSIGRSAQSGFGLLAALFAIAAIGLLLSGAGEVWQTSAKRERERELLFVGRQFRQAIIAYYQHSPGAKNFPKELSDLLEDKRQPRKTRYLRRIYRDPLCNCDDWGLIKAGDSIIGVYSRSDGAPLIHSGFPAELKGFADAKNYSDWKFTAAGTNQGPSAKKPAIDNPE